MTLRADTLVLFWKDRHSNWNPSIFLQISLFSFEKGNERTKTPNAAVLEFNPKLVLCVQDFSFH